MKTKISNINYKLYRVAENLKNWQRTSQKPVNNIDYFHGFYIFYSNKIKNISLNNINNR